MLEAKVPSIDGWKAIGIVPDFDIVAVGNRDQAACWDRGEDEGRWAVGKRERTGIDPAVIETLVGEHRQILRYNMAEDGTEDSDIEAAAIAGANHGLLIDLVGKANPGCDVLEVVGNIHAVIDRAVTCHANLARFQISETALAFAVDGLGRVELPANAKVKGKIWRDAPTVLDVGEDAILRFLGVDRRAYIAAEAGDVAEQEGCQPDTAACARILCVFATEGQLAGAVGVAGYTQIPGVSQIDAELDAVIANDLGPVVGDLVLILGLDQGAIASVYAQAGTEVGKTVAVAAGRVLDIKSRRAGGEGIAQI